MASNRKLFIAGVAVVAFGIADTAMNTPYEAVFRGTWHNDSFGRSDRPDDIITVTFQDGRGSQTFDLSDHYLDAAGNIRPSAKDFKLFNDCYSGIEVGGIPMCTIPGNLNQNFVITGNTTFWNAFVRGRNPKLKAVTPV
jgi:hypothetical protein